MQTFTDLVGTAAVPAHAYDIAELMELTPALYTAQATHGTSVEASEASATYTSPLLTQDSSCHLAFTDLVGTSAAVPAHAFDIDGLTELTPTMATAQATVFLSTVLTGACPSC